ncbi:MAG: 4Fe-4S binding protein [Clostridiaceae bacterium]|nr:4Fe-4S binding protein [Clostridiaceae bacterium]
MILAVLSGKGGTGKTTVAASLARVVPDSQYVDCDVEEPNGFLFLNPEPGTVEEVMVPVPSIDPGLCTLCGACARICQFNAIAVAGKNVLVFPELCHHCGACALVCKPFAITEEDRRIGVVETDPSGRVLQGRLDVGEPVGVPIISELKRRIDPRRPAILDCAPGASCAVVRSLEGSDYALLVTEPTPFGLHDVSIALQLVKQMGIPAGVVLNKASEDDAAADALCREADVPILLRIPFSRDIAEQYSRGRLPVDTDPVWADRFRTLYDAIRKEAKA